MVAGKIGRPGICPSAMAPAAGWSAAANPKITDGSYPARAGSLAGAAGVGRQAAHDLLQQFAVALLGLADGPGVLVHEAEPAGHGPPLPPHHAPPAPF